MSQTVEEAIIDGILEYLVMFEQKFLPVCYRSPLRISTADNPPLIDSCNLIFFRHCSILVFSKNHVFENIAYFCNVFKRSIYRISRQADMKHAFWRMKRTFGA